MPVFALLRRRGHVVGGGLGAALGDAAAIGVVVGLVVGKAVGVFGGTWAVARFTRAELDEDLAWADVLGLSLLAGVGFTVGLLDRRAGVRRGHRPATTTSRWPCWAAASSPPCWPPWCCACETGTTASSRSGRGPTTDHDGIPDVYQAQ